MNKSALIVFAKKPETGKVKTRLTSLLTAEEAAELYAAFLQDALAEYTTLAADVRLYVAPPDEMPSRYTPDGVTTHVQKGADLGERMLMAFVETFAAGYEKAIIIGTDHPSLPTEWISMSFEAMTIPFRTVIGPSEDGGYFLIGMNELYPILFERMTYSHDQVFDMTLERAADTSTQVVLLPNWYDIDTPKDLKRLIEELPDVYAELPHTRAYVAILQAKYPELQ